MKSMRILLADDHSLVRAGFCSLIEKLGYQVIGEANDGQEVLRMIPTLQPDIILMDIAMPSMNGLETTTRIQKEYPAVRVVILSMHATVEYARHAIRAGAAGYLLKDASAAELDLAILAVARGESFLSPRIAKFIVADYAGNVSIHDTEIDRLTTRQREILELIAKGRSRKEIAENLNISVKTFDSHRAQIMELLGLHGAADLFRFAQKANQMPNDE
ncbi:MAG: response regulator transcription factor [Anaerolineaceae bacterium]|nr:response regulator transcription factor [Anaerolineaceae bacterium]